MSSPVAPEPTQKPGSGDAPLVARGRADTREAGSGKDAGEDASEHDTELD